MPYKRGLKWMGQKRIKGKLKRKTFPTKKEAIAWEMEQGAEQINPARTLQTVTVCLIEWAEKYLDFAKVKFSAKTYQEKQSVFRFFFKSVDPFKPVSELTSGDVLLYLQGQAEQRSGYAANKERKNLVAAWNWGIKYMGLPALNPCLVDRFPEQRQTRYVPPERDFWKAYDAADTDQDRSMLLAYLHLAARRSELFGMRWEDVDFSQSRVRLYTRKRKDGSLEFDWLPMTDELSQTLLAHRQEITGRWVFPDPATGFPYLCRRHWMKRLCDKAEVKPFGIHAIRHLTASILAKANVPMVDIQAILRHKHLATTERYIKRLSDLKPALSVLPGKKAHKRLTETKKELALLG